MQQELLRTLLRQGKSIRPCVISVKRWGRCILPLTDNFRGQLREKHPSPQEARFRSLLFGVMHVTKPDVIDASGSLQVCAGHKSGSEAAIHAVRSISDADETDAVLLIDASNAFNAVNRAAVLHNIRVLCPTLVTYVINTYRQPARLFITGA